MGCGTFGNRIERKKAYRKAVFLLYTDENEKKD